MRRNIYSTLLACVLGPALVGPAAAQAITSRFATVNGVRLHYLAAGSGGTPVVLLHGYAETSRMWRPLMAKLAASHVVIAPDLRGIGESEITDSGYTKMAMAEDVHALVQSLGLKDVRVVGHDIGLMVAYAYAWKYPGEVNRVALMDAFLPGVGDWKDVTLLSWHFHFYGKTPEALVRGRERIYFEHFWNDFAADPKHSVPESDRRFYTAEYARPRGMWAGFECFRAFDRDALDFARMAKTPLRMPLLALSAEKSMGDFLVKQAHMVATNAQATVVKGSGHWLMEEAPDQVIPALVAFVNQ